MKKLLTAGALMAAAVLSLPAAGKAQAFTCPTGYTMTTDPSTGAITCSYTFRAPEISASSSVGGVAVLMCGAIMLRRRKRTVIEAL